MSIVEDHGGGGWRKARGGAKETNETLVVEHSVGGSEHAFEFSDVNGADLGGEGLALSMHPYFGLLRCGRVFRMNPPASKIDTLVPFPPSASELESQRSQHVDAGCLEGRATLDIGARAHPE